MDEVDRIIIHSLRRIGCSLDDGIGMGSFTPEQLVPAVVSCMQQIKPDAVIQRATLPTENMAQRFAVAASVAELCAACGYRNDIGYQTFLYPSAMEVRRLFMFLIEQLPKSSQPVPETNAGAIGEFELRRVEIKEHIRRQLHDPWIPQYARGIGNRKYSACSSSHSVRFAPQLNLNIPGVGTPTPEVLNYLQQQAPTVFQQTAGADHDLMSSVLHKNDFDFHNDEVGIWESSKMPLRASSGSDTTPVAATKEESALKQTPLEKLNECVNALKTQNDAKIAERKATSAQISTLRSQQASVQSQIRQLFKQVKMHERTCVVLDTNPKDNLIKLEGLIQTTKERRKHLEKQWQDYRRPMLESLDALKAAKQAKNAHNVVELRQLIAQLEQMLREKTASHAQLSGELKNAVENEATAPRKEYTRRIMEFIGNIRKQRNDIFKVLDDTRDLQKQLNSVSAQLHRQFNYTDDLLFQSAKHDIHAKKAYKLLATLHTTCNELVELVSQTGSITKEIRDLEVHIDREKLKNVALNLEQISADIRNFESTVKTIQTEIRNVENEITVG